LKTSSYNPVQVPEAAKALEASNGTALEDNGQLLRVAFAKSIYGGGPSAPGSTPSQLSQVAAAAIEAATFAQQVFDLVTLLYRLHVVSAVFAISHK
jgi:hypothetical protein